MWYCHFLCVDSESYLVMNGNKFLLVLFVSKTNCVFFVLYFYGENFFSTMGCRNMEI